MKKLMYRLENRATGEKWEYETIAQLCEDPKNDWIKVSIHRLSKVPRNTSYTNKVCIVTKYDTEFLKTIPTKKIFKIKE